MTLTACCPGCGRETLRVSGTFAYLKEPGAPVICVSCWERWRKLLPREAVS